MELAQVAVIRQNVHHLVITALITTHPEPGRLADLIEQMFAQGQIDWAQNGVEPAVREISRDYISELIEIARLEASRRPDPPRS
jgi:hypothetical protein